MAITFVTGDLFTYPDLDALAHGCNCAGAMGKGIAVEFKNRNRQMYREYKRQCTAGKFWLGSVMAWRTDRGKFIFNLGTQKSPYTGADLQAIEKAVKDMVSFAEENSIKRIGLPRIGAGLGGANWEDVKKILETIGAKTRVELIVVSLPDNQK